MTYAADIYVSATGCVYGASETDQRYTSASSDRRTVRGERVAYAGRWYGSQMSYRPYQTAVAAAAGRAAEGTVVHV